MRWEVYSTEDYADVRVYGTRAEALAAIERRTLRYRRAYGADYSALYIGTHDIRPHWRGFLARWGVILFVGVALVVAMLVRW